MKKNRLFRITRIIAIMCICFCLTAFIAIAVSHACVFRRFDYEQYDTNRFLKHDEIDHKRYPYRTVQIQSGENILTGFMYGEEHTKGLVVISPGHTDTTDIKLYEILHFVDDGWTVLCYDYTGCYTSQGSSMKGYTQPVYDLDAVLTYIEGQDRFKDVPLILFGHSLGAYASAAVLSFGHNVDAAVIASGFDTPEEQWLYSIERFTGPFHTILKPFTQLFINIKYGKDKKLSSINGINSVSIPVLVISGKVDEFYGKESPIYAKKSTITNLECEFMYMETENHNGHYDYFLTDEALLYQKRIKQANQSDGIDKILYMQHDFSFMNKIHNFMIESLE